MITKPKEAKIVKQEKHKIKNANLKWSKTETYTMIFKEKTSKKIKV